MLLTTKQEQKQFFIHTSHSLSNYAYRYFVCLVCTIYNAHFIERLIIPSKSSSNFTEIRKYFNPLSQKLIKRKTLLLNKSAYLFCKKNGLQSCCVKHFLVNTRKAWISETYEIKTGTASRHSRLPATCPGILASVMFNGREKSGFHINFRNLW